MSATPAQAQRKIINGIIGMGAAGAILNGTAKGMNQDKPRSNRRSGEAGKTTAANPIAHRRRTTNRTPRPTPA